MIASLSIYSVDASDSGKYRCEANNRLGRVETSCKVTVNGELQMITSVQPVRSTGFTDIIPQTIIMQYIGLIGKIHSVNGLVFIQFRLKRSLLIRLNRNTIKIGSQVHG